MSGLIAPWFLQQFRDTNGSPLAGGKLYFYVAGSTTVPKNVYVDYPLTTPYSQPVILDGSGFAPEYYMETGLYKIVVRAADGRLIATRDNVQGVGGTGGPGGDAFSFYISASDSAGGYFTDKIIDSPSVSWVRDDVGGYQRVKAVVNTAGILDYKVKADGADSTPGYLNAKLEAGNYIGITLNNTTHKLKIDFNGPAYVPQAGGTFTGPVSFGSTVMATGGCFFGDTIFSEGITVAGSASVQSLVITDLIASGPGFLICDNTGAVSSVPGTPGKVQYSGADAIPGYLGTKIVAGTGITINTTVDGVNGTVMHINSSASPVVNQPANQVVVGTGTGITSYAALKGFNGGLQAGNAYISQSGSQPSNAYFGTLGGDPGGGGTCGMLVNSTNIGLYTQDPGRINFQQGVTNVGYMDSFYGFVWFGAFKLAGVSGVGTAGTLVVDAAGQVSVQGGTGTDYYQTNISKASPYTVGTTNTIINPMTLSVPAGTYHVSVTAYIECTVSSGTSNVLVSAETSASVITTDGYTGYSDIKGTGAVRMIAIAQDRKITLGSPGTLYFGVQTTGTFTAGICWGHMTARRIS